MGCFKSSMCVKFILALSSLTTASQTELALNTNTTVAGTHALAIGMDQKLDGLHDVIVGQNMAVSPIRSLCVEHTLIATQNGSR